MTSYIHRITNQGSHEIHLIVLSPDLKVSYDVVLGPGEEPIQYDKLLSEGGAPIPVAESADQFANRRIKLRIENTWFSIYECQGTIRCVKGDAFDANAPQIASHPSYPAIDLVVTSSDGLRADYYPMVTGSGLVYLDWGSTRDSYAVYGRGDMGNLVQKYHIRRDEWEAWKDLKGPSLGLAGPVAAVSWLAQRYSIYALGNDGNVYELSWLTTYWNEWNIHSPPPSKIVGISAVSWITDQIGLYVTTESGNIYVKYFNNGWSGWSNFGRPTNASLLGPITAVSWSSSRYGVYALGDDGNVWQKWWQPLVDGWSDWESTGAPPAPAVIKSLSSYCLTDRDYVISAVCSDNNLWVHRYCYDFPSFHWRNWESFGHPGPAALDGTFAAGLEPKPTAVTGADYCHYARGVDGAIYRYPGWRILDAR